MGIINVGLKSWKKNTGDKQEGKTVSDIDVCKKSGSQSLYKSHDGGETFSWWLLVELVGFPGDTSGKEPTCQCRRHTRCGFNPWASKIPWRMQCTQCFAWRIPQIEDSGGLWFIGSQRVGHNWSNFAVVCWIRLESSLSSPLWFSIVLTWVGGNSWGRD